LSDQAQSELAVSEPQTTETTSATPESPAASILGTEAPAPALETFDAEKLAMPEGLSKDDSLWGDFVNVAKEHSLPMPVAQTLVDLAAKQVASVNQKLQASWDKQNEDWQAEIRADKEIGGDKLSGMLQTFSKVASDPELSDPKFREALAFTGAGNHPAIVRTLAKWANALSEGGPVRGGPGNAMRQPSTLGEAIYGPDGPHTGGPRLQ
jgi:hypothetical protein